MYKPKFKAIYLFV